MQELKDLIKKTASEAQVEYSHVFGKDSLTKTVSQAGLVDGSVLQFQNGMDD